MAFSQGAAPSAEQLGNRPSDVNVLFNAQFSELVDKSGIELTLSNKDTPSTEQFESLLFDVGSYSLPPRTRGRCRGVGFGGRRKAATPQAQVWRSHRRELHQVDLFTPSRTLDRAAREPSLFKAQFGDHTGEDCINNGIEMLSSAWLSARRSLANNLEVQV